MSVQRIVIATACAAFLLACSKKKDETATEPDRKSPAVATPDSPATTDPPKRPNSARVGKPGPKDTGDFKPVYGRSENTELADGMREAKVLEGLAEELNSLVALPGDVDLALEDCGEANAYYDEQTSKVAVCYELIELFAELFDKRFDVENEAVEATVGATLFTLFHEVGHALVHELELPVTGKEEDAVDQLAALVLIAGGDEGRLMALDGAESFLLGQEADGFADLPFWDTHSLDEQRFYNIACLVYGADPDNHRELVKSGDLPEERAEGCAQEFEQIDGAWDKILEPHLKEPLHP